MNEDSFRIMINFMQIIIFIKLVIFDKWLIKKPPKEVQLEAVRKNPWSIRNIKDPPLEVQLEAVKQNPLAIRCIKNPSLEVCNYIRSLNNDRLNEILLEKLNKF